MVVIFNHAYPLRRPGHFSHPRAFEVIDISGDPATRGHCNTVSAFEPPLLYCVLFDFDLLQNKVTLLLALEPLLFDHLLVDFIRQYLITVKVFEVLQALLVSERLFRL